MYAGKTKFWKVGMQTKDQTWMVKFIMIKPKIMNAHSKFMQPEVYACIERLNSRHANQRPKANGKIQND